jgi:DNA-binding response OmpR family regulator
MLRSFDCKYDASNVARGNEPGKVFLKGDIRLDSMLHLVTKAGIAVHLQRVDFALLEFLMQHPAQIFSSKELLEKVWGNTPTATQEGLRVSICRVRKALDGPHGSETSIIETVHRVGYRLGI